MSEIPMRLRELRYLLRRKIPDDKLVLFSGETPLENRVFMKKKWIFPTSFLSRNGLIEELFHRIRKHSLRATCL